MIDIKKDKPQEYILWEDLLEAIKQECKHTSYIEGPYLEDVKRSPLSYLLND